MHPLKRGFTLIELLVVVSIIAILATLLLPGIAAVREASKKLSCAGRLRQVMMTALLYANEHHGQLAPASVNGGAIIPASWGYSGVFANAPYFNGALLGQYIPGMETCKETSIRNEKNNVFHCPADPRVYWHLNCSYGMNMRICTEMNSANATGAWPVMRLARITRPSDVVLFADSPVWTWHPGYATPAACYGVDSRKVLDGTAPWGVWGDPNCLFDWTNWHKQGVNLAFFDGHVRASINPAAESAAGMAWFSIPP
jgi:prepilin-type N-terminal cleavage/methylation domain-containing protein/prepilin-type processing-associated H-X9-DG protein